MLPVEFLRGHAEQLERMNTLFNARLLQILNSRMPNAGIVAILSHDLSRALLLATDCMMECTMADQHLTTENRNELTHLFGLAAGRIRFKLGALNLKQYFASITPILEFVSAAAREPSFLIYKNLSAARTFVLMSDFAGQHGLAALGVLGNSKALSAVVPETTLFWKFFLCERPHIMRALRTCHQVDL